MSTQPAPPLGERGSQLTFPQDAKLPSWQQIASELETLPELSFPQSVDTYRGMMADPQVFSLMSGLMTPVRLADWYVDAAGAPPDLAAKFADDVGLPLRQGDDHEQERATTKWDETVRFGLTALVYGFASMEQVGYRDVDGAFRYQKLGPRLQQTIREIKVDRDGGLSGLIQEDGTQDGIFIPVGRLVQLTWERIGDNWYGRPLLRAMYQPFLLRDELLRIDLIRHRRNGMGVPLVELPEGATQAQTDSAARLAEAYRVGEAAGGSLPYGMRLRLAGVEGSTSDVLASIKYADEVMARALLEEVRQLGTTSFGSRALGETHEQTMAMGVVGVMEWLLAIVNEHIAEDWAAWNNIPETAPVIGATPNDATLEIIKQAVDAKLITPDDQMEAWIRRRLRLPPRTAPRPPPVAPLALVPPGTPQPPPQPAPPPPKAIAAAGPLRRNMTQAELASGFDPLGLSASMDANEAAAQRVVDQYLQLLAQRMSETPLTTLEDIARVDIEPTPEILDALAVIMERQMEEGRAHARREAAAQGVTDMAAAEPGDNPQGARDIARRYLLGLGRKVRNLAVAAAEGTTPDGISIVDATVTRSAVETILAGQKGADFVTGMISAATQQGRQEVWSFGGRVPDHWLATEILDKATCDPCELVDGQVYTSWDEASADYPSGRYSLCEGRDNCRGQLIAVY